MGLILKGQWSKTLSLFISLQMLPGLLSVSSSFCVGLRNLVKRRFLWIRSISKSLATIFLNSSVSFNFWFCPSKMPDFGLCKWKCRPTTWASCYQHDRFKFILLTFYLKMIYRDQRNIEVLGWHHEEGSMHFTWVNINLYNYWPK